MSDHSAPSMHRRLAPPGAPALQAGVVVAVMAVASAMAVAAVASEPAQPGRVAPSIPVRAQPPSIEPTPAASVYGDGAFHVLRLVDVGRLDADAAADLLFYQQPDGLVSMRAAYALGGREDWPRSARIGSMGPAEIRPPAARTGDSVEIVGTGDLNGDGRLDLAATRTHYPGVSEVPTEIYIYFGPAGALGGAYRVPDVTVALPAPARCRVRFGDIDGDGASELMILDPDSTRVLAGRAEWPSRVTAEPFTVFTPPANEIFVADFTGDGIDDALFNVDSNDVDVALLSGRRAWAEAYDLVTQSDWTAGTGRVQFEVAFAAELNGDAAPDFAVVEGDAPQLLIIEGPIPPTGRQLPEGADWSILGIDLTTRDTEEADMTGDGIGDLFVNGFDVFLGGLPRTGGYTAGSEDVDAHWPIGAYDYLFAADVNGDGAEDVLVNEVNADGAGREQGAGAIHVYTGPIVPTPAISATPRPSPSATSTAVVTPTPSATQPEPTVPTSGHTVYLPAATVP